jgi:hypothetical protein
VKLSPIERGFISDSQKLKDLTNITTGIHKIGPILTPHYRTVLWRSGFPHLANDNLEDVVYSNDTGKTSVFVTNNRETSATLAKQLQEFERAHRERNLKGLYQKVIDTTRKSIAAGSEFNKTVQAHDPENIILRRASHGKPGVA